MPIIIIIIIIITIIIISIMMMISKMTYPAFLIAMPSIITVIAFFIKIFINMTKIMTMIIMK